MKRRKIIFLGLTAGVICVLGWWIYPRPLNVSLRVEKASLKAPLMGDPLATQLSVLPAPEMPDAQKILSSNCVWTLQSIRYRRSSTDLWQDVTPASDAKNAPAMLYSWQNKTGYSDIFFPRYSKTGEWKSVVRADVTARTFLGNWRGAVTHEISDILTAQDLQARANTRLLASRQNERDLQQSARDKAPEGAVALVEGKRYIGKIQWSEDSGTSWHDVPASGRGAVAVPNLTSLGLRAVKANPKIEWPDYPDFLPFWTYAGQKYLGDKTFLQMQGVSNSDSDLRVVTVHCEREIEVKVRILPPGELVVYAASEVQINARDATKNREITRVYARSASRDVPQGAKILFTALNADGSRSDLINKPGRKDDAAPLNNKRASALLRKDSRPGSITISAQLLDKNNVPLANSDVNAIVNFAAPISTP